MADLNEIMAGARQAQQNHEQAHDVQLEIKPQHEWASAEEIAARWVSDVNAYWESWFNERSYF